MSERIESLRQAIERSQNCRAVHVVSTPVTEWFEGQPVWEGVVETFDLIGHAVAKRCYAWSFIDGGDKQYTTILGVPPVNSPESAVKAAIAAEAKGKLSR